MLGMIIDENGTKTNKFYSLDLQISRINALTLNWTVVHPIDASSPMSGLSAEGDHTIIEIDKLNSYMEADISAFSGNSANQLEGHSEGLRG